VIQIVESILYAPPHLVTKVMRVSDDQPSKWYASALEIINPAVNLIVEWRTDNNADVWFNDGNVTSPRDRPAHYSYYWSWIWTAENRQGHFDSGKLLFSEFYLRQIGLAGFILAKQMLEVAIEAKAGRSKPKLSLRSGERWVGRHDWRLIVPIASAK
jgi:hypothetical protein